MTDTTGRRVLLTGASGYVGGRLLPHLVSRGLRVRCLARRPDELRARYGDAVEIVQGDVLDRASLDGALRDVDTAYYLVHALDAEGDFEHEERAGAANFAEAARAAGVRRIVFLGGLAREGDDALSAHMRSRHEVGAILRTSGCETFELRASIVIGSGSASFEMLRALVERLPVMVTPRWVSVETQPIAIDDLLAYLLEALDLPAARAGVYEIGGAARTSYGGLLREYARQRGLRRAFLSVPVLTPRLSSLWLGLVTPYYARVGRKLVDSITRPSVVRDANARDVFRVAPMGFADAIAAALREDDQTGAHRFTDARTIAVRASPAGTFVAVRRIGGRQGWYAFDFLWQLRGWLDLAAGGVGLRRGRRDPDDLRVGDALDWWRVEALEPDRLLRLRAELRLPGRAWLEFEVEPADSGSLLRQTATFDPRGLGGLAYWTLVYPLHALVFRGMLRGIARAATREDAILPQPGA